MDRRDVWWFRGFERRVDAVGSVQPVPVCAPENVEKRSEFNFRYLWLGLGFWCAMSFGMKTCMKASWK